MNWIRDHFKLVAEGHDEPVGRLDRWDGVDIEDDGTVGESLARVEVPRGSSQAGLQAVKYGRVA